MIYVSTFRSVEPQGTASNRTKLNSAPAQTPASASAHAHAPASAQIPTHAPAPQLPPSHPALVNIPLQTTGHTEQGEESEGRGSAGSSASAGSNSASAGYNSAGDSEHITGQHQAPLTEQLQSRSVEKNSLQIFLLR